MLEIATATSWKRFRIALIISLILLLPLSVAVVAVIPMPAIYTTQGILTPVANLGIQSSVYFTYVEEGITRNLFERFVALRVLDDPIFTPITNDEVEEIEEEYYETESLIDTLQQAVAITNCCDTEHSSSHLEYIIQQRVFELMSNLEGYYGNSLGLMVAIGLYEEDQGVLFGLLRGEKIAGTGALYEDGIVGTVGALEQKLLGAEAEQVDLFFVPADYEQYGEFGNEAEAQRLKTTYQLNMEIVPVRTFDEAIQYLWNH